MSTFRMRAVNSRDIVGTLIDIVSDSSVDHVEGDSGKGWLGAHSSGGVQERSYNYMTPSLELVFEFEVDALQLADALVWAKSKIGTPYNFGAIVGILFHDAALNETGHLICSQFMYEWLLKLGIKTLNSDLIKPHDVTPGSLILSHAFEGKRVKDANRIQ